MTYIETGEEQVTLSLQQSWNHYLALAFIGLSLVIGANLRDSSLYATSLYENVEAGIRASYPRNWLIDTKGDYIFRVRNFALLGYKTTIQVSTLPVGNETAIRNVIDNLTINRSQTLAAYRVLDVNYQYALPDDIPATLMRYTFADTGSDPYLQSIPFVVEGIDILSVRRGQVIVISFLADQKNFAQEYETFQRFLLSLEF